MTPPLVSVVIPAYQRAESIGRAIDSALAQTMGDLEVIVVDDGSTDGTAEVVRAVPDSRVRLLAHETNKGGNAARQTGIDAAQGTWVAFLDSDDAWLPEKLARQLARLAEAGPDYGLCYTWFWIEAPNEPPRPSQAVTVEGLRRPELLAGNLVGTFSTMLVSRAVLGQVGGLDLSLPSCQDWDLVIRLNRISSVCVVPEPLAHYALSGNDPYRISTRKQSVIDGHRLIYRRLRESYPEMSDADVASSQEYVMGVLAQHGAVLPVLQVARDLRPATLGSGTATYAGHMVLRAARRRVQVRR